MNKDFITVTPDTGSGNGSLSVVIPANAGAERSTTINVAGSGVNRVIPVTQAGFVYTRVLRATQTSSVATDNTIRFVIGANAKTSYLQTLEGVRVDFTPISSSYEAEVNYPDGADFYLVQVVGSEAVQVWGTVMPPFISTDSAGVAALVRSLPVFVEGSSNPNLIMGHNYPTVDSDPYVWEPIGQSYQDFITLLAQLAQTINKKVALSLSFPDGSVNGNFPINNYNAINEIANNSNGFLTINWEY